MGLGKDSPTGLKFSIGDTILLDWEAFVYSGIDFWLPKWGSTVISGGCMSDFMQKYGDYRANTEFTLYGSTAFIILCSAARARQDFEGDISEWIDAVFRNNLSTLGKMCAMMALKLAGIGEG